MMCRYASHTVKRRGLKSHKKPLKGAWLRCLHFIDNPRLLLSLFPCRSYLAYSPLSLAQMAKVSGTVKNFPSFMYLIDASIMLLSKMGSFVLHHYSFGESVPLQYGDSLLHPFRDFLGHMALDLWCMENGDKKNA